MDNFVLLHLFIQINEDFPDNIESLQYLEALCKDLGRPYEEYSKKLDKLRRSVPVQAQQVTRTAAPSAPARSERPKPERSERPGTQVPPKQVERSMQELSSGVGGSGSPLKAPSVAGKVPANLPLRKVCTRNIMRLLYCFSGNILKCLNIYQPVTINDDEDDFADTDVGNLLG
jgi:hypothetical protein